MMTSLPWRRRGLRHPDGATASGAVEADPTVYWQRFAVTFDYPVCFTRDAFAPDNRALIRAISRREPDRCHRAVVVIDAGVVAGHPDLIAAIDRYAAAHASHLQIIAPPLIIPGGETAKTTPALLDAVLSLLHDHAIDRQSLIIAIGGGAVLDLAGYAAAVTHRGVRLVRLPSTVLAQNDAGIGVKNGVNAFGLKNYLGTFAPPYAVINDFNLLTSLATRDRLAGIAEAVKVAIIRDATFFVWLEAAADALREGEAMATETMIRRCAELHLRHIASAGDPFEMGSARPLDFGHWAAHKLENLTAHRLRHGEAVAIGIALDSRYAAATGLLDEGEEKRIVRLLERLGLPLWDAALCQADAAGRLALLLGIAEFREHLGGELTVTLPTAIGAAVEVHALDEGEIVAACASLRRHYGSPCS
jgi:3-dehydroquinate synthase